MKRTVIYIVTADPDEIELVRSQLNDIMDKTALSEPEEGVFWISFVLNSQREVDNLLEYLQQEIEGVEDVEQKQ